MPKKDKYWYIPWMVVGFCALIFSAIGWYIVWKDSQNVTTATFTAIIVAAGTVLLYVIFIAFWDTLHQAITKKKQTIKEGNTEEDKENPVIETKEDPDPQVTQEQKSEAVISPTIPAEKKPTVIDLKLESFDSYSLQVMSQFVARDDLDRLMKYIGYYARRDKQVITKKISTSQVDTYDLLHFGWNMWNHFKVTKQPEVAIWLKSVFAGLKDSDLSTIEHNLRHKERGNNYLIKIVEVIE